MRGHSQVNTSGKGLHSWPPNVTSMGTLEGHQHGGEGGCGALCRGYPVQLGPMYHG